MHGAPLTICGIIPVMAFATRLHLRSESSHFFQYFWRSFNCLCRYLDNSLMCAKRPGVGDCVIRPRSDERRPAKRFDRATHHCCEPHKRIITAIPLIRPAPSVSDCHKMVLRWGLWCVKSPGLVLHDTRLSRMQGLRVSLCPRHIPPQEWEVAMWGLSVLGAA